MDENERDHLLMKNLSRALRTEVSEAMLKYNDYPTWVIYSVLSMELCKLALIDGMSVHDVMEGILKTYRLMEKDHEHKETD